MWCFIEMFNRNHEKHYQSGEIEVETWCSCSALMFCSCPPISPSSSSQEQTSRTCFNSHIPGLQSLSMCETCFISIVKADKMKMLLRKDLEDGNLKDIAEKCFFVSYLFVILNSGVSLWVMYFARHWAELEYHLLLGHTSVKLLCHCSSVSRSE